MIRWAQLADEEVIMLKQHICQEIVMHPIVLTSNQAIKTKVGVVLCNLAERMFPQRWPTMVQEFLGIWLQSEYQRQEVIIKTFEFITADCIDADFNSSLTTLRRQEIVAGLVEHQEELLQTSFDYLNFCRNRLLQLQQQRNGQEAEEELRSLHVAVQSLLTMLTALADLVKSEEIVHTTRSFLAPTCLPDVLSAASVQYHHHAPSSMIQAAQFLLTLSQQKLNIDTFVQLVTVLCRVETNNLPEDLEQATRFQRLYSQALHNIISQNMHFLVSSDQRQNYFAVAAAVVESPGQCLQVYTGKMLALVMSPSRKLAFDAVKDWVKVSHPRRSPAVRSDCTALHCTLPYCTVLHCTLPYCTALYCTDDTAGAMVL